MNKQSREALDAYYAEAGSWAKDQQDALRASRRTAWIVASVAVIIALAEAIALVVLMPLKTVEPYTLLVDKQTGHVQALRPLDVERITPDRALTQSFLVQYVIARESFDIDALPENYRKVALWSAESARSDYLAGVQVGNPASPLNAYPRSSIVETRVKSVSPLGQNVAMVRFETQRRDAGGGVSPPNSWVAIIRFRFSGEPMRVEDRLINPLGFQVVRYNRSAEALPPEASPSPAVSSPRTEPEADTPVQPRQVQPPTPPAQPEIQL